MGREQLLEVIRTLEGGSDGLFNHYFMENGDRYYLDLSSELDSFIGKLYDILDEQDDDYAD